MPSIVYTPSAGDAEYPNYTGIPVQDPTTYSATSPERCDAKYFGLKVQNELLSHQDQLIALNKLLPVWSYVAIGGYYNNLDLDVDNCNYIVLVPSIESRITGIVAPSPAGVRDIVLMNGSASNHYHISPEDALSTAANRLLVPDTYQSSTDPLCTIYPYDSIRLSYDVTNSRWRKA